MPKRAPAADPEPTLDAVAEAAQAEAKSRFRLEDRLTDQHFRTDRVLVFTDGVAVETYGQMQDALSRSAQLIAALDADSEARGDLQEAYDAAEDEAEAQKAVMMQSALAIRLRAQPQAAFDTAARRARKAVGKPVQLLDEDEREQYSRANSDALLGLSITSIRDATGAEADFDRKTVGNYLRRTLPIPQYARLSQAFNLLVFNDQVGRAATADPGF